MDAAARNVLPMLPALAALAETGQTLAAADLLQMPQPTVSRMLARLGRELGVDVVERHGRGLRLTRAGEALAPHAAAAVAAATAGIEAVQAQESGARGRIALAFQSTLGERVVPALVKAFLQEHPGTSVDLIQTSRPRCLEVVTDGTAEIALISPLEESSGMRQWRLHTEPLVLVVPTGHRLSTRARVSFEEAAAETFICMKRGYGMRTLLEDLAQASGVTPTIGFEGDDLATLRGLVSAGLGVSLGTPRPARRRGLCRGAVDEPGGRTSHRCLLARPPSVDPRCRLP
ncbi:MAG: LysR family transcriptional regulator [Actinomycetota bacterium]|nr:LysR family transcriptional regulator [Actinomycetota bacterium]